MVAVGATGVVIFLSSFAAPLFFFLSLHFRDDWFPWADDGPFTGQIRNDIPEGLPDQELAIAEGWTLKVYDKKEEDIAPTVLLEDQAGEPIWCIYATSEAEGEEYSESYSNCEVDEIEFYDFLVRKKENPIYKIRGTVHWTFGRESMNWYLNEDGSLYGYFYSW